MRPRTRNRRWLLGAAAVLVVATSCAAAEPGAGLACPVLEGLAGDGGPVSEAPSEAPATPSSSKDVNQGAKLDSWAPPKRSFAMAAGQTLLMNLLPWAYGRYGSQSQFAFISWDTLRNNLETGFTYDRDEFRTNQYSHPYHGALYFGAARQNGYSFWESGVFTFFGSMVWEVTLESQPPAINDLVSTTLGGMDQGEIMYRLGRLLRDETARGGERFWRELGGAFVDPMGGLNRLIRGELKGARENPPDRFPSRFVVDLAGFGQSRAGGPGEDDPPDQLGLALRLRYGDLFDGEHHGPYEFFELALDMPTSSRLLFSRAETRGVLFDGPLGNGEGPRQRLALMLHFVFNQDGGPIPFGGESFDLSHLSLVPLRGGAELRTEAGVTVYPIAALGVDHEDVGLALYGRDYDYGPVAGVQASARIRRRETDLVGIGWSSLWQSTLDGVSRGSRLQRFSAEARVPFPGDRLSVGAEWAWSRRTTTYDAFPTVETSGSTVRVLVAVTFR